MPTTITVEVVKRLRDAHGAICRDCHAVYEPANHPYWHWSKGAANHRSATSHRVDYFRLVLPPKALAA